MKGFNLSDWALGHRSFVWFLMLVSLIGGGLSYMSMGREEDPSFTIRTMVVSASMPGSRAVMEPGTWPPQQSRGGKKDALDSEEPFVGSRTAVTDPITPAGGPDCVRPSLYGSPMLT